MLESGDELSWYTNEMSIFLVSLAAESRGLVIFLKKKTQLILF